MLRHDLWWNKPNDEQDAEGNQDDVIEVAQERNEVRDEIDGRQRVSGNGDGQGFRIPGDARIATRKIEGMNIAPERPRPCLQAVHWPGAACGQWLRLRRPLPRGTLT